MNLSFSFFHNYRKKEKTHVLWVFLFCVVVNLMVLTTFVSYIDGFVYTDSFGVGSSVYRWGLDLFNMINAKAGYSHVVPMFSLMVSFFFNSVATLLVCKALDVRNYAARIFISFLIVLSPAFTQINLYAYATPAYSFALVLGCYAIFLLYDLDEYREWKLSPDKNIKLKYYNIVATRYIICYFLFTMSFSLYEVYVSFYIGIFALIFMKTVLDKPLKEMLLRLALVSSNFILAFASKFIINAIWNEHSGGILLNRPEYGESLVGGLKLSDIVSNIKICYEKVFNLVFSHNVFGHSTTFASRIAYGIAILTGFLLILYIIFLFLVRERRLFPEVPVPKPRANVEEKNYITKQDDNTRDIVIKLILLILLYFFIPIAINLLLIAFGNESIPNSSDRMFLSYVVVIILPIFLYDYICYNMIIPNNLTFYIGRVLNKAVVVCSIFFVFHYSWFTYGSYYQTYNILESTRAYSLELVARIHATPGFKSTSTVVFCGNIPMDSTVDETSKYYADVIYDTYSNVNVNYNNMLADYVFYDCIKRYAAWDYRYASEDEYADYLKHSKLARELESFPSNNCVAVDGDYVLVRLGDLDD